MRPAIDTAMNMQASVGRPPDAPARTDDHSTHSHRGRLFRRYLLFILSLVSLALLLSGAITIYFSYQEHRSALSEVQQEKAVAAASRIEQYLGYITRQLSHAAMPQIDAADGGIRRIEFLKILRQTPEFTEFRCWTGLGASSCWFRDWAWTRSVRARTAPWSPCS